MVVEFEYKHYHPGGWTDDLGIIADQNTFVPQQRAGWYWFAPNRITNEMHDWCREYATSDWNITFTSVRFSAKKDAVMFQLRFS